ncbi:MAG: MBL fold metallo-hydrolase [Marivibrio sp.]|uniref:MBL fold metallo-hydrolase n=1 Tax=Marivibrio sp. TaxID=2039719 RepID=UPI0032EC98EE
MTTPHPLDFAYDAAPAPGALVEVAPGLHWLRMPIPLDLDHINLWLIEDQDAAGAPTWTLIDSGFGDAATQGLWRAIFDGPAAGRRPHRLICTHYHPDHFGLAGWLERTYGVTVEMTETEWIVGSLLPRIGHQAAADAQDAFFARHGMPADMRGRLAAQGNEFKTRTEPPPAACRRIRHGQTLTLGGREWEVIVTEGHASEHACLSCADLDLLICGDQLLPKITPNISVYWFRDGARPLAEYLESLDQLEARIPASTLVLPSHKLPYRGAPTRVAQLRAHHAERLEALAGALGDASKSAFDLTPALFPRRLDDMHMMFALGETIAHLEHLAADGRAVGAPGEDGVKRWRAGPGGA